MTTNPNSEPEQIDDGGDTATWQRQIAESTNPADALLEAISDETVAGLPVAERIALAQTFYLRAAVLAQVEIACQVGDLTDMLGETNDALWDISRRRSWWPRLFARAAR